MKEKKSDIFYGKFADKFLNFSNGVEFLYYAFTFNMYNNDNKQAIYALENNKIIPTFKDYMLRVKNFYKYSLKKIQNHYLFIGDSHLLNYEYLFLNKFFKKFLVFFCRIQGSSSYGLKKKNSKSGAIKTVEKIFRFNHKNPKIFLNFGEVDCRSTLWLVKKKRNKKIDVILKQAILNYKDLVLTIKKRGYSEIILIGVIEPLWKENNIWTKKSASYIEVKKITKQYNKELKNISKELGCDYFDINDEIKKLLKKNQNVSVIKGEHHLNPQKISKILYRKIYKYNLN